MSTEAMTGTGPLRAQELLGRIERLPFGRFHVKVRLILGTATFFDSVDAIMIAFILPVIIRAWGLKPVQIGLLISVGYIGQTLGAIFFGWLAERVGRVYSTIATITIFGLMSLACALSWSYNALFVFRTIQGVGLGGEVPIAASYINELSKAKGRGRFFLLYEMLFVLGTLVSAILGYVVVPRLGWRAMFYIGALPALLILFLRRAIPESPRWLISKGRLDEAEKVVAKIERIASQNGKVELPPVQPVSAKTVEQKTDWRELFRGIYLRRTIVLWVCFFATFLIAYGLTTWLPSLYTTIYKLPVEKALRYSVFFIFGGFVGACIVPFTIDKVGRRPWFALSFFITGIFLIILWLTGAPTAETVLGFGFVAIVFIVSNTVALYLFATEIYPTRLRALGASIGSSWLRIASATGPVVIGWLVGTFAVKTTFLAFGLVAIAAAIVVLVAGTETKNRVLEEISP